MTDRPSAAMELDLAGFVEMVDASHEATLVQLRRDNETVQGSVTVRRERMHMQPLVAVGPSKACTWTTCEGRPWVFCEAPSRSGYSYCATHVRRVFWRLPEDVG